MKVIENNFTEPVWKIVCPKCNSVLEYGKSDVISHESYFFYLHYIECPCCGSDVDVKYW